MGRKRNKTSKIKPFCYYCDRNFEAEDLLLLHQKARHFKCSNCNRKLDTIAGLVVHLLQVHKKTLHKVANALPDRDSPDLVIHGMTGIPLDLIKEKQNEFDIQLSKKKKNISTHTFIGSDLVEYKNNMYILKGMEDYPELIETFNELFMNKIKYHKADMNSRLLEHLIGTRIKCSDKKKNVDSINNGIKNLVNTINLPAGPAVNKNVKTLIPNILTNHPNTANSGYSKILLKYNNSGDVPPTPDETSDGKYLKNISIQLIPVTNPPQCVIIWSASNISPNEYKAMKFYGYDLMLET